MEALLYLTEVSIIYAVLYLFYFLFFRNNTNFQVNRFYLLLILPLSFILPSLGSNIAIAEQYQITLPAIEINKFTHHEESFNWSILLTYIYFGISSILLLRLGINVIKTLQTISNIKKGNIKEIKPFSFFSFIHVPHSIEEDDREAILHHEKIHTNQLHSFDIIIYEIGKVILWWNPFVWIGLNSVRNNHEYIADKLASEKTNKYSSVLVAQLLGVNCSVLANNFNYEPLIKKRIMMMKAKESNRLSVLKYALVIPVIVLATVVTTNKEAIAKPVELTRATESNLQNGDEKVYDKVDVMPEFKGGMEALMNYLVSNIKYPEEAKKENMEGQVFIGFVIDTKGNIKDVSVMKSVNELLDQEAMRVVKAMPKWKAGKHEGKKVNVKFTLPINFKLS